MSFRNFLIYLAFLLMLFSKVFSDPIPFDDDWGLLRLNPISSSDIKIKNNNLKYKSKTIKLETTNNIDVHVLKNNLFVYEKNTKVLNIFNLKNTKNEKIKWEHGEPKAVLSNKCSFIRDWLKMFKAEKKIEETNYLILAKFPFSNRTKESKSSYAIGGGRLSLVYSEELGFVGDKKGFKGPDKALYNDKINYFGDVLSIENIKDCEFGSYYKN